jgi:hypothetical protein
MTHQRADARLLGGPHSRAMTIRVRVAHEE